MIYSPAVTHLDDGRVLWQGALRLGGLTHSQVLDVTATEDDVLKDLIARGDGSVRRSVLRAKGANCRVGGTQRMKRPTFNKGLQIYCRDQELYMERIKFHWEKTFIE